MGFHHPLQKREHTEHNGGIRKDPEEGNGGHSEYVNDIDYNGRPVNMFRHWEDKLEKGETARTKIPVADKHKADPEKRGENGRSGRKRWKIENEGFNRQKNWQGDVTHACSHNANAMKNHYLMTQIADMVKQLYEWFYLKKKGIKKKQKNISSDLLISLGVRQQPENIYEEPNESALNQEKYSKGSDAWQEGKTKKSTKYNSVG